jgi:opacity protein-like surface antigen
LRLLTIVLASLAFGLAVLPAHAVDLPPAPILDEADEAAESGWYLRGDVGAVDQLVTRGGRDFGSAFTPPLVRTRFERDVVIGGGIGYQFSPWFRADVTVDRRFDARIKGTRFASETSHALDRADFDATTLFLNGYVDLALWDGITPYIGAGIGMSRNRLDGAERNLYGPEVSTVLTLPSRSETALAWTLMGGVAFDLGTNLKLDLGYRYTHLGHARTGSDGAEPLIRARNISAHEFRIGARYVFD